MRKIASFTCLFLILSCGGKSEQEKQPEKGGLQIVTPGDFAKKHTSFDSYWYRGLAELGRYDLKQMRYGRQREGHAVLVFVTEDFRLDRQVKYEGEGNKGEKENVGSVLKLNAHRRFDTGVYPYSVLTSSFSHVDDLSKPVKVSTSVQEWCGHTFSQLNQEDGDFRFKLLSYFDSEGDQERAVTDALSEDGFWAMGRRDPKRLPVGDVKVLPALHVLRFRHIPAEPIAAVGSLRDVQNSPHGRAKQVRYELDYKEFGRRLIIYFEAAFPHRPLAWEEIENEGERTVAIRREEMMLDYWNHNGTKDASYREALGL